jgi:CelD/BcsL family acetyltransferase involved in cellulose biosynthesis
MLDFSRTIGQYTVEISEVTNIDSLREQWQQLERNEDLPFFLSWSWVEIWIQTYKPKPLIVTARYRQRVVAMGLFTFSAYRGFFSIKVKQLCLHQTGDHLMDQIWMEYNDFICESEHQKAATNACLAAMMELDTRWDKIILSMMTSGRANDVLSELPNSAIFIRRPCYTTSLTSIRENGGDYLATLTANTRYQIRRSIREYEKRYGTLSFNLAGSTNEALDFFRQAGPLHKKRWKDSGYGNQMFVDFHENLISTHFESHSVDLIKINAGDTTIAIIYNHIRGKKVFFYLHGLRFEDNPRFKPGLVAHSMATQYYLENGMEVYDYMGGYSQYKEQLSEKTEDLVSVVIQRSSSRYKMENIARKLKYWIIADQK